jgi:hypothetical protein
VKNGTETDTDCGGSCAPSKKCADGLHCSVPGDCTSGVCTGGICQVPKCSGGLDGVKNGTETDIDCGGASCPSCADGKACLVGGDCTSKVCNGTSHTCSAPTCTDSQKNGSETDVDCGGGTCVGQGKKCADGKGCMVSTDCTSANCVSSVCQPATQSGLSVQYSCLDPGAPTDRFLQPAFKIGNASSNNIPFSELKIRYWFTDEAGGSVFSCRSAVTLGGCTFVSGAFVVVSPVRTNADHYLEISFTGTATLNAGTTSDFIDTPVSSGNNYNETNDYSYDGTNASKQWPNFADHTKVTLYRNGTLVWGTEP